MGVVFWGKNRLIYRKISLYYYHVQKIFIHNRFNQSPTEAA
jgi:hypothetical protein